MIGKKSILYRRKREGKTNYKKRLNMLKSKKPRLIIRKTNKQLILQIANYEHDGDIVVCGVNSSALKKLGWKYSCNSIPACYLAGLLLGKKAKDKKVAEAILDVGLQTPVKGSRLYAGLKGVIDAGIKIPVSEDIFPSQDRLSGKHVASYFSISKNPLQFADYKKNKLDPKNFQQEVENLKKKILGD